MKKPSKPASKPAKARPRRALKRKGRNVFKPRRSSSFADELARVTRERDDALQQQTATSEVLQVISRSAGNLQPVFEIILENAVRICDAKFGVLYLHEGGRFRLASAHNVPRGYANFRGVGPIPPVPGGMLESIIKTGRTTHVLDHAAMLTKAGDHLPLVEAAVKVAGMRSVVGVPMLKNMKLLE
jgi:hypothetical protein